MKRKEGAGERPREPSAQSALRAAGDSNTSAARQNYVVAAGEMVSEELMHRSETDGRVSEVRRNSHRRPEWDLHKC